MMRVQQQAEGRRVKKCGHSVCATTTIDDDDHLLFAMSFFDVDKIDRERERGLVCLTYFQAALKD